MANDLTYDIAVSIGAELVSDDDWSHLECQDEVIQDLAAKLARAEAELARAEAESKKIEREINTNKTSTNDNMEQKLATLTKELETYLALFRKAPPTMIEKTAFVINGDSEWVSERFTGNEIYEYIRTHTKVDGKDWSCGEFGGRWADAVINGKMVRLCFTSKKSCPSAFEDDRISKNEIYQILVDVIGDAEDKKAKKYKKAADDYTEVRKKAIKNIGGGVMMTNNAEVREMMKTGGRRKSRGECVFYWHRQMQEVCWATNDEMREQAKLWKKSMKKGNKLQFLEHNCQTKLVNGEEWHILVCGHETDDLGLDPLGMGIDDGIFMVSGLIYWFKHKESRDTVFAYLTGN